MADNSENIGGINVSIGADYSPLQEAIQEATQAAETGGQQIAQGMNAAAGALDSIGSGMTGAAGAAQIFDDKLQALFDQGMTLSEALTSLGGSAETLSGALTTIGDAASGAAEQLSLFDEAATVPFADAAGQLNLFATELEPIGSDAEAATSGLQGLGDAVTAVGSDAQQGASGLQNFQEAETETVSATEAIFGALQDLGQQFLALAEAFVVVEGLKEFGAEALEASDSIKTASISLTQLTGSAETAETTIGGLEKLGMSDGLAMPSLLECSDSHAGHAWPDRRR